MNNFLLCKGRLIFWHLLSIGCCLLLCLTPAVAGMPAAYPNLNLQQHTVSGHLRDASGPVPGVTVSVKGKNMHTVSTVDGTYSINAEPQDILIFESIGYKRVELSSAGRTTIDLTLEEDPAILEEVTINAGYYSVKEKENTGSIARITSKDIENQPVTNFLAAMQGRMAGVDVIQDSGSPGGAFQIRVRGQNSLRADGNQPLYVINGIPYSSETIGSVETSGTAPTMTSPLNSINPSDIESIEVLKDADATAIYGSRGANGVVLITTKKGKAGKSTFTMNASTAVGQATKMLDLMKTPEYLAMRRKAYVNDGITQYPASAYDVNGTWGENRYTDWQKELIGGTAEIHNLQASVSGGSRDTQYLIGGTYRTETTVFPGDFNYRKGSVHFNMNHSSENERFKAYLSAYYTAQKNRQPTVDLTRLSRTLAPNAPAMYDGDGNLNWENSTWDNPLAGLEQQFNSRTTDLAANALLSYDVLPNLQLRSSVGYTELKNDESRTQPYTMYNPAYGMGSESSGINTNLTTRNSWIIEPQLNWKKAFGKAAIEALVGGTFQQQATNRLYQAGFGFSSNSLINDLASASIKSVSLSDRTVYKYQAFYSRMNFNWDGRYIINITGRRDGSSRFGPGKQFANFGAVGAAWIFSKEAFLTNNLLSFGKLRASYGTSGNDQIGDYQYLDTYTGTGNTYQGIIGIQPSRLYNPEFGWETNRKLEIAIESGFLKDRLFLTAAFYRNRSSNQLVGLPLPATTGFTSLYSNLGAEVQNSGLEFTLRTVNLENRSFGWTSSFNISLNRNKLLSYPGLEGSPNANTYVIGQPTNISKLYHYEGIDPITGLYKFRDENGDGIISSIPDRQTIANLNPKFFGGLQNQFSYKGLRLEFLFQFVKQQAFGYRPGAPGRAVNQLSGTTESASSQPFTSGTNSQAVTNYTRFGTSDAALQDASYIRLKNIALSYELPLPPATGVKCNFFIQGQNLLTVTPYKSGDPEFKFSGYLPPLRVVSAGAVLTLN